MGFLVLSWAESKIGLCAFGVGNLIFMTVKVVYFKTNKKQFILSKQKKNNL
jgi:hypothetical protein